LETEGKERRKEGIEDLGPRIYVQCGSKVVDGNGVERHKKRRQNRTLREREEEEEEKQTEKRSLPSFFSFLSFLFSSSGPWWHKGHRHPTKHGAQ